MSKCRKLRGLIAASLYEEVDGHDRQALEEHLSACPRCRAEHEALGRLKAGLAGEGPELGQDLVPVLRARIVAEETPRGRRWGWRLQLAGAVCLGLAGLLVYQLAITPDAGPTSDVAATAPDADSVAPDADSAVQKALREAAQLSEARDFQAAYAALQTAVEAHPDDGLAGEAQARLAAIAFGELQWYPQAYEAHRVLAGQYPGVYMDSPECIRRMNLLDEARAKDYDPLYKLDAARLRRDRGSRDKAFGKFEEVIALYPGTYAAGLAAGEMARCVAREVSGGEARLAAMEQAKDRCTHPIAVTQLKLEIAHIHRDLNHHGPARDLYQEIAESEAIVLANLARESLAALAVDLAP